MECKSTKKRPSSTGSDSCQPRHPSVISLLEVYGITEAKRRLGWSTAAYRAAKRRGLRVIVCGKRHYVTGREIVRFLEAQQSDPSATA